MGRLFTFGCSFTQYGWPTWADIIGYDSDLKHYNFGLSGLGNVGIMHRVIEADLKYQFTPEDEIYILWTSWSREDRIKDGRWNAIGSVFNAGSHDFSGHFIRKYWDMGNDIVKNASAIIGTNRTYARYIKWQGKGFEYATNEAFKTKFDPTTYEIMNFYKPHLPDLENLNCEDGTQPFEIVMDCHPDVKKHLSFVQDYIYPSLNRELKHTTVAMFEEIHDRIQQIAYDLPVPSVSAVIKKAEIMLQTDYRKFWHSRVEEYSLI